MIRDELPPIDGAMGAAIKRSGLKVDRCSVHGLVKPCNACAKAFKFARRQARNNEERERKAAHAEYLEKQKAGTT